MIGGDDDEAVVVVAVAAAILTMIEWIAMKFSRILSFFLRLYFCYCSLSYSH